jgi:hypothetical protein
VSVNDFVEECRREWRRLRVPDPVANEMAADLKADLDEAEAEGASAEAVLGRGAFDPRSFAASWAAERGVVGPQLPARVDRLPRRSRMLAGIAVSALVALIGVALAATRSGVAVASVPVRTFRFPPPPPGPPQGLAVHAPGVFLPAIGLVLLLVGIAGAIVSLLYWFPWAVRIYPRRSRYTDERLSGPGSY